MWGIEKTNPVEHFQKILELDLLNLQYSFTINLSVTKSYLKFIKDTKTQ